MYTRIIYLSALISLVAAHGTIVAVKGANGITGAGMGIDPSTPRDGTRAKPFQQDTSVIRDKEIESGKVGACGRTTQKGAIDMASEMEGPHIPLVLPFDSRILTHTPVHTAAASNGIPSATASGEIQMTLHQVNQDGAGPYTCDISADGGNTFQAAKVTKNVPGAFLGLSTATAEDFPLNVQMPSGMQCAGGPNGDACVVRCRNATPAGPFGSCAVVTNAQPAGGAGAASAKSTTGKKQTRALAGPDAFADEDAKDAELEAKLISGINKRFVEMEKKRVVRSRVVGGLSGYWIKLRVALLAFGYYIIFNQTIFWDVHQARSLRVA
ncbi:hypothetical protein RHS01_06541 [Rhizoctonia solani]|uniref:GEgh 16 protein n=1 Tax=Rhizoctonia solani TaxID=456999 RepID=A0A8H7I8P6_9AGAM|nr:hypothetical protein RHS01_06541 [Rhizoctonia solani]